ncbi:LysR substrate-binding domain-containing protein [Bradyrhizobium oropedii]|uniref:LysR substrate-binding domain-containing protein n=1 Tax=Bradyrhizobium oropedii TaxID=1571201 RepID=UPI003B8498B9
MRRRSVEPADPRCHRNAGSAHLGALGTRGQKASVAVEPKVSAGDFTILIQAAQAGIGIALLPELECQGALRDGRLVRVLPDWSAKDGIIHLVFPSRRGMLPGVRATIDLLAGALKAQV